MNLNEHLLSEGSRILALFGAEGEIVWSASSREADAAAKAFLRNYPLPAGVKQCSLGDQILLIFEPSQKNMAATDPLTGLLNRSGFEVETSHVHGKCTLLALDLDGFKRVNDSQGHDAGDAVLAMIAKRLSNILRKVDLIARFGGDEFVILICDEVNVDALSVRIIDLLAAPIIYQSKALQIGVSIGITEWDTSQELFETAHKRADIALYGVKEAGKGSYAWFNELTAAKAERTNKMYVELERAILLRQISFNPINYFQQSDRKFLRAAPTWQHPEMGEIAEDEFAPIVRTKRLGFEFVDLALCAASEIQEEYSSNTLVVPLMDVENLVSQLGDLSKVLENYKSNKLNIAFEIYEEEVCDHPKLFRELVKHLSDVGFTMILRCSSKDLSVVRSTLESEVSFIASHNVSESAHIVSLRPDVFLSSTSGTG